MHASHSSALTLHDVGLVRPDGTVTFDHLDLQVPPGRVGLVGANGSGKTSLLRLFAGDLAPTSGRVTRPASIGLLPQDLPLDVERGADEFLGVAGVRAALHRLAAGDGDAASVAADLATVGDDWDLEDRLLAELTRVGLPEAVLGRRLGELSGGEVVRLGLTRLLLARPDVLLLDEPTTNLDRAARARLVDVVDSWRGGLVIVSHDPALLEHVDRIGDLDTLGLDGTVRFYGGGWSAYREQRETEQAAAEQVVTTARAELRRERADLVDVDRVLAKRRSFARTAFANTREPRAVMRARKRTAQNSAAAYTRVHEQRLDAARDRLEEAEARVREDARVRVDLPDTEVPAGRTVLRTEGLVTAHAAVPDVELRGPERVALLGPNGSGKTTLLRTLAGEAAPRAGRVTVPVPLGYLPQRLDILDPAATVVENVRRRAPGLPGDDAENRIRAALARFGLRGRDGDRLAGVLSGGERFRASLAAVLLARPAPQVLLLDEPTNSLDLASREALVSALAAHRGALLVASHDEGFLHDVGTARGIMLG